MTKIRLLCVSKFEISHYEYLKKKTQTKIKSHKTRQDKIYKIKKIVTIILKIFCFSTNKSYDHFKY